MSVLNLATVNSSTQQLAVTATSANIALTQRTGIVLISNTGANSVLVKTGVGSGTTAVLPASGAAGQDNILIPAGTTFSLSCNQKDTYLAAITTTGTSTIFISAVKGGVRS